MPNLQRGEGIPQFCILIYANYTILATQRGGRGTMPPLNTPLPPHPPIKNCGYAYEKCNAAHSSKTLGTSGSNIVKKTFENISLWQQQNRVYEKRLYF